MPDAPIVLYDGECGLCHRSVKFILDHEADHELRFAPLQGEVAAELRAILPTIPANVDTVVLVTGGARTCGRRHSCTSRSTCADPGAGSTRSGGSRASSSTSRIA